MSQSQAYRPLGPLLILILWSGFWSYFVVANAWSDGPSSYPYVGGFLVCFLGLPALWFWKTSIGSIALTIAAIGSAIYFDSNTTRLILSLPILLAAAWSFIALLLPRKEKPKR